VFLRASCQSVFGRFSVPDAWLGRDLVRRVAGGGVDFYKVSR